MLKDFSKEKRKLGIYKLNFGISREIKMYERFLIDMVLIE